MFQIKNYFTAALVSLFLISLNIHAEDIDIYDSTGSAASNPNILLILDNSSNWSANNQGWPTDTNPPVNCGNDCSKQGYYELKAIRTLISDLNINYGDGTSTGNVPINIGLMMFNSSQATRDGAYVRSPVVPMTAANRAALIAKLDNIISNFNTETASASLQYSSALFDAFKYFGGFTNPTNARNDSAPATNPQYSSVPIFGPTFWGSNDADGSRPDSTAYNGTNYNTIPQTSCGRNYIVFIGNGYPKSETNSDAWGTVLSQLINPANPQPIVENSIITTSAGSTCGNLSALGLSVPNPICTTLSVCETARDLLSVLPNSINVCNRSTCGTSGSGQNRVDLYSLQSCNLVTTTTVSTDARYADEYTGFLYNTDVSSVAGQQNVTTYTIDVYKNRQDFSQTALMRSMASAGGGKYFAASDLSQLGKAFSSILAEIQSVNSVFASSSLPVSVNTQGTYLNQVFVGMFRPDTSGKPRWFGNLKQYQFKIFDSINLRLADFSTPAQEAISASTGFITPCAVSAWTTDTANYWQFNANSAGLCDATTKFSDAPDGAVVEKGGAAQRLRGVSGSTTTSTNYLTRALKTCDGSNCNVLLNFNDANTAITQAALGVSSASDRTDLINWVRGKDVYNENNTTSTPNTLFDEMRPSVHGGVVHSQPAVVDYGGTTGVVSYYGADDGVFHAVNGNKNFTDGNEYWGFIAPESYSKLTRLRDNTVLIKFPTFSGAITPTPQPKDYFFDGSIGVFQRSSTVWIYPTMRRGGRAIYAFNVSDPANPVLKWRRGCYTNSTTDDSNCTSDDWKGIGQTWSKPQIAYLNGYVDSSNNPKPVLVFGGGYDTCEDKDSQDRCTTTPRKGANIWFVDADTGNVIRTYATNYSVPGEITLLTDASGNLTYAYAADTGGYLYRINAGTYDGTTFSSAWTSTSAVANITIASMSETNQARKFLFGPDVIVYAGYNAVAIGSGDREHPLSGSYACNNFAATGVKNQFYIIKDRPAAYPATPITPSSLTDVTTNLSASESSINNNGLRFDLVDTSSPTTRCEQTVNKALTIGGVVYFGSNAPKSSSEVTSACGINLGNARSYAVDFLTGAPAVGNSRSVIYKNGGLPPSPVGGVVDIDGKKVPFCIGCTTPGDTNPSPLQGSPININPPGSRQRLYWYLEAD
jgi:type IV pilus assembly protein PilY1